MAEPQPVPINAKFQGDFVTQLVLALDTDTMAELAEKVAHHVVGRRVPKRDFEMVVRYRGEVIPPETTVADAGIAPLQNVYVDWADSPALAGSQQ